MLTVCLGSYSEAWPVADIILSTHNSGGAKTSTGEGNVEELIIFSTFFFNKFGFNYAPKGSMYNFGT